MQLPFTKDTFDATLDQWTNWHWQLNTSRYISKHLELNSEQVKTSRVYPLQITPYFLSLIQNASDSDPIYRQCFPSPEEISPSAQAGSAQDPFAEEAHCFVPRLVHRYKDRALFITTSDCAMHCRHCMRKRNWGVYNGMVSDDELAQATSYLREHPEIREVLISGGDPLVLDDAPLDHILRAFAAVPSIERLRIGSRTPAALPQRLTPALGVLLGRIYHETRKPIWLAAHFNHVRELTPEAACGLDQLIDHGVPVVSQTVLLKGVNDTPDALRELFSKLLALRVKPYYLFHGDPIEGTMHFRTGVEKGLELLNALRGDLSGLATPAFSFDLPDGGGKIRLEPTAIPPEKHPDGSRTYVNFEGREIRYR